MIRKILALALCAAVGLGCCSLAACAKPHKEDYEQGNINLFPKPAEGYAGDPVDGKTYGRHVTEIINRKGFKLPTTGGFGTLLFSGIGVLLVVGGVGVLMSTKKKKKGNA